MICKKCGQELTEEEKFCSNCGKKVTKNKKNKKVLVIVISLVLAFTIGMGIFLGVTKINVISNNNIQYTDERYFTISNSGSLALAEDYRYNKNTKKYGIYYNELPTTITIPKTVEGIKVTKINDEAFYNCKNIEQIRLPDSIKIIGNSAFSNCTNLKEIQFSNSLEEIGEKAFLNCKALNEVNLPDSVAQIGYSPFSDCSSLQKINIPKSLTKIPAYFVSNTSVKNIEIPKNILEIGGHAFQNTQLQSIKIPETITKIPDYFVESCPITNIEIPANIEEIGGWAFYGTKITNINIPNTVKKIGTNAFKCCPYLETAEIHVEDISSEGMLAICRNLKTVIISEDVIRISGRDLFEGCINLTEIEIPETVKYISMFSFETTKGDESIYNLNIKVKKGSYADTEFDSFKRYESQRKSYY